MLLRKKSTRKKAIYIHREINESLDGYQTCGYDPSYTKGFNLVFKAFKMPQPQNSMKTQKIEEEAKSMMPTIEKSKGLEDDKQKRLSKKEYSD